MSQGVVVLGGIWQRGCCPMEIIVQWGSCPRTYTDLYNLYTDLYMRPAIHLTRNLSMFIGFLIFSSRDMKI